MLRSRGIAARWLSSVEWERAFVNATAHVRGDASHAESRDAMRNLVRSGLVRHTDLRDNPERFFQAHRLLARHAVAHGPGFWIRFTVHYNLCYGTVLGCAQHPDEILEEDQAAGRLGCFALTEKLAGVQSGLVVNTRADYVLGGGFVLHTPHEGARKNWISQGLVADRAVVVANLFVHGERKGPHAFLVRMRDDQGRLSAGVEVGDMGTKTTGNDLDNAWINFDHCLLPKNALLDKYCDVDDVGYYTVKEKVQPFSMIGQRLYTGRIAVAQAALAYRKELFRVAKEYADNKLIPQIGGVGATKPLASIPQLKSLFQEAEETGARLESFVDSCEQQLIPNLRKGLPPNPALAHAIAVAKVKAVEDSIDLCWRLKQDVGSYALMADSGFKHLDFLSCCKFAEGDSRILMQKMARDAVARSSKKGGSSPFVHGEDEMQTQLVQQLLAASAKSNGNKAKLAEIWDDNYTTVYALADAIIDHTMRNHRADWARAEDYLSSSSTEDQNLQKVAAR